MKYTAGTIEKNGVEVEIFVDTDGRWLADVAGKGLVHPTRDKLADAIGRMTKRVTAKVEVPFFLVSTHNGNVRVREGVCTGIHSGNGNLLVTWKAGNVKEQIRVGFSDDIFSEKVYAEQCAKLLRERSEAEHRYRSHNRQFRIALEDDVKKALDDA